LKTLPVAPLSENGTVDSGTVIERVAATAGASAKKAEANLSDAEPVFTHGVEIVVQGSYLDMLHYMDALESMPWQLFWSKARLQVEEYPKATLTLTLYTLSLDKKWLNL
jgi:MSHA biogenesis protein MshJ